MSSFVVVCRAEESKEDCIELPTEDDGSLLLSVLQSQFEGASGLKYRNPDSGSWRAIKLSDGQLKAPSTTGWEKLTYYVVIGNSGGTETPVSMGYHAANPAMSVGYLNDGTKRIKLEEQSIAPVGTPHQTQPYQHVTPSNDLICLGLEWSVTTDDLKSYFEKYGEITSAEVKTDPTSGASRGFGFIRFKDPEVYQRVCEQNHAIKGRKVEVKLPNSRPAKFAEQFIAPVGTPPHLAQPKQPYMYGGPMQHATSGNDLIVLGLEWTVKTEDLKSYFEKFGEITSAEVKTDPTSGASRGFGFIRFKDPEVYQRVCELNHAINGRKVEVKLPNSQPAKVFVGCLPLKPPVEKEELETHFSEFGTLTDVYVPHEPYRGFAFITFRDPAVAQRVMSMQHTLRKSQLNLSLADPKGGAKAATHQHTAYAQQGYYQQQQQYAQYSQYAQQQGLPQATAATAAAAYGYNPYGNTQARASYNRGFMDSRAHLQYSQDQAHRSMLAQNPAQANPAYTHQQLPQQQYTQQQLNPNPLGPQTTTSFPAGAQLPNTSQQGYNVKGVWSNY